MIERTLILAAVLALAWGVQAWWVRRTPASRLSLPPGLSLVVAEGCRLCRPALAALHRAAPGLQIWVIDPLQARGGGLAVRSVPTAVVVDQAGRVRKQRSGPAVLREAPRLAQATRSLLAPPSVEDRPSSRSHP